MSEKPIIPKIQIPKKNSKKFVQVLRHLSQSENLKKIK